MSWGPLTPNPPCCVPGVLVVGLSTLSPKSGGLKEGAVGAGSTGRVAGQGAPLCNFAADAVITGWAPNYGVGSHMGGRTLCPRPPMLPGPRPLPGTSLGTMGVPHTHPGGFWGAANLHRPPGVSYVAPCTSTPWGCSWEAGEHRFGEWGGLWPPVGAGGAVNKQDRASDWNQSALCMKNPRAPFVNWRFFWFFIFYFAICIQFLINVLVGAIGALPGPLPKPP